MSFPFTPPVTSTRTRKQPTLTTSTPARSLLNFKNIPYRTQWVEYPDIAPLFESLNVTPNPSGAPTPYSSPAITLPDGKTHIMDSLNIARYLDEHYPDPPAYVSDPMTERIFNAVTDLFTSIRPILIPRVREYKLFCFTQPSFPKPPVGAPKKTFSDDGYPKR